MTLAAAAQIVASRRRLGTKVERAQNLPSPGGVARVAAIVREVQGQPAEGQGAEPLMGRGRSWVGVQEHPRRGPRGALSLVPDGRAGERVVPGRRAGRPRSSVTDNSRTVSGSPFPS